MARKGLPMNTLLAPKSHCHRAKAPYGRGWRRERNPRPQSLRASKGKWATSRLADGFQSRFRIHWLTSSTFLTTCASSRASQAWSGRHTARLSAANTSKTSRQPRCSCSSAVSGQNRVEAKSGDQGQVSDASLGVAAPQSGRVRRTPCCRARSTRRVPSPARRPQSRCARVRARIEGRAAAAAADPGTISRPAPNRSAKCPAMGASRALASSATERTANTHCWDQANSSADSRSKYAVAVVERAIADDLGDTERPDRRCGNLARRSFGGFHLSGLCRPEAVRTRTLPCPRPWPPRPKHNTHRLRPGRVLRNSRRRPFQSSGSATARCKLLFQEAQAALDAPPRDRRRSRQRPTEPARNRSPSGRSARGHMTSNRRW